MFFLVDIIGVFIDTKLSSENGGQIVVADQPINHFHYYYK